MSKQQTAVVIGGSRGLGLALGQALAARGEHVYVTSRDQGRADEAARQVGQGAKGLAVDLAEPDTIADKLAEIGAVDHLVLAAIERDANSVGQFDIAGATRLVTLKLVGYTEVVHVLASRFTSEASVVLFGGLTRSRPYPGSTTVTTVNGGVTSLVGTLAVELAPLRVNAIHPGVVGDTPAWSDKREALDRVKARTPIGRTVSTADIVGATLFLLDNRGVNGVNLTVDGGTMLT